MQKHSIGAEMISFHAAIRHSPTDECLKLYSLLVRYGCDFTVFQAIPQRRKPLNQVICVLP